MTTTTATAPLWTVRSFDGPGTRTAHLAHGRATVCGVHLGFGALTDGDGFRQCRRCLAWLGREWVAGTLPEACACPDDRCAGHHHPVGAPCPCAAYLADAPEVEADAGPYAASETGGGSDAPRLPVEVEPCPACGHDEGEHISGHAECCVCDCGGVSEPTAERPAGHPAWCQPDQCDRLGSPDNMTRHRAKVDVLVYVTAWQADGEPVAAPVVELLPPDEDLTAEDAREVGQGLLRAAELIEGARG